MGLTDDTDVMESLRLSQGITLKTSGILELLHSGRVFLLRHQGISQVEGGLRILAILLYSLTVGHFGIGIITGMELFISLTDILAIRCLRRCSEGHHQEGNHGNLFLSLKERDILQQRVATIEDANLEYEEEQSQKAKSLELFVKLAKHGGRGLFLRQFVELIIKLLLCRTVVLYVDISTAASLSHLLTHLLVKGRHHRVARIILHIIACTRNGDRRTLG